MGLLSKALVDENFLLEGFAAIYKKAHASKYRSFDSDGVSIQKMWPARNEIVKKLKKAILEKGPGQFEPAQQIEIKVGSKYRTIYKLSLFDLLLHTCFANLLTKILEPQLSPSVHSYRKGRSNWLALKAFTQFLKKHRKSKSKVQNRGLFLLKRDVSSYGDSIPVSESSPIWSDIESIFNEAHWPLDETDWKWIKTFVRPVVSRDQTEFSLLRGLPVGSPLSAPLSNCYLAGLDFQVHNLDKSFYIRFGDDLLFVTEDSKTAALARELFDKTMQDRGLRFGEKKSLNLFFNGAGRPNGNWQGSHIIKYLGVEISFAGNLTLPPDKLALFKREFTGRLMYFNTAQKHIDPNYSKTLLGDLVKNLLSLQNPEAVKYSDWLWQSVNSRSQLKEIDLFIWTQISRMITSQKSRTTLRKCPINQVRKLTDWQGLLQAKNKLGKKGSRH